MSIEPESTQPPEAIICDCTRLLHEDTTRMVLEAAPIGIIAVATDGRIVLANRSAQHLFGYSELELIDQPLTMLIPEESREIHLEQCAEFTHNPHIRPMGSGLNLSARRKDGSVFPAEISLGFTETPQGLLSIAFIIDITRQREAEQLRDTMIHTLIHDLRNPLSVIRTGLEFLDMEVAKLDSDQKAIIAIAINNTEKMLTFVNTILEVSRLESGKVVLHPTVFRIQDQIAELLTSLAPLAEKKTQKMLNNANTDLPPVQADVMMITRVLENLLGNALKFAPDYGAIKVSARRDAGNPSKLRIEVSDNGPGIPAGLQNRIFEKFFTGGGKIRGYGLGLTFCKLALQAHGESITMETAPTGTTFSFTLPVASPNLDN